MNEQYTLDGLSINPAYAGRREALSVAVSCRNQWLGFEGAPRTEIASMHSQLVSENIGAGLLLINDQIGVTKETGIMGNYSYTIKTGSGKLSFGLGAGMNIKRESPGEYRMLDERDEVLGTGEKVFVMPDFSAGVYYYTDNYYAGFSMPFFMNHRFNPESGKYTMYHNFGDSNYMLTGGYLWKINEDLKLLPNTLFRFRPNGARQIDLNLHLILKDKFWLGTNYRSDKAIIWTLQYQINSQFRVAYSYGNDYSEINSYQKGTHEIMLRYDFKYLLDVISPRYF